jgi:hypothetical protein
METFILESDVALLLAAGCGLIATLLAIVQDTRNLRGSAGLLR